MAENDAQLELKKRARRRLIGAIALVLAAAVFLPIVMDSEPRPTGSELQIRIPSQEGSRSSHLQPAPATAPVQVPPVDPEPATSPAKPSAPEAPSAQAASSKPAEPVKPAETRPAETKPTEAKPAEAKSADTKSAEAARARAILEHGAEPTRYFVQLGVFHDTDNIKGSVSQIKRAGMVPSVEKIAPDRTRVRVGPFKTKQAAEQAVAKLKKAGAAQAVVTGK